MATVRQLPVRDRIRSRADKGLFFLAFLIGTAGILALKLLEVPQRWVIAFPVATMLLYLAATLWFVRFRLRDDRTADNCYYLGLLFTLVSLAYALWDFTAEEAAVGRIVGDFGIALITTIFGLALRVVVGQLREDPVEVEREARLDLAEAATRLRSELDGVVLDLNAFRRGTQQALVEALQEVTDEAGRAISETSERMRSASDSLARGLEQIQDEARHLADPINQVVDRLRRLVNRIEKIEVPSTLISDRLTPAVSAIENAAQTLRQRADEDRAAAALLERHVANAISAGDELERRAQLIAKQLDGLQTLGRTLEQVQSTLAANAEALRETTASHSELAELVRIDLEAERRALTGIAQAAQQAAAALRSEVEALATDLGAVRSTGKRFEDAVVDAAERIVHRLGPDGASQP